MKRSGAAEREGPGSTGTSVTGALLVRDVFDAQLESSDRRRLGRVADLEAIWDEDGRLRVVAIVVGPQALLGRLSYRLRSLAYRLLNERFQHRIPITEVDEIGPTVRLRRPAADYDVAAGDAWVAEHIIGRIPGSGRGPR